MYFYARSVKHQVDLFHRYYSPKINLSGNAPDDQQNELRGVMVDLLEQYNVADD